MQAQRDDSAAAAHHVWLAVTTQGDVTACCSCEEWESPGVGDTRAARIASAEDAALLHQKVTGRHLTVVR